MSMLSRSGENGGQEPEQTGCFGKGDGVSAERE